MATSRLTRRSSRPHENDPVLWRDADAFARQIARGLFALFRNAMHNGRPASPSSTPRTRASQKTSAKARATPKDTTKLLHDVEAAFRSAGVLSQAEWRTHVSSLDDMLSADEMSKRLGISSRSEVLKWVREHRLFSVMPPGRQRGQRFPQWQIDVVGADFTAILTALAEQNRSDWSIYEFFETPAAAFSGLAPRELLLGSTAQGTAAGKAAQKLRKLPIAEKYAQVLELVREGPLEM